MSKFKMPDLPSDDELGITDEDRERYEEDLPADRPELSKDEMVALLGQTFAPKQPGGSEAAAKGKKKKPKKEKKKRTRMSAAGAAATLASTGPRTRVRGPATLAALVGLAAFSSSGTSVPRPVPANASDGVFSSSRAMSTLIEIARRPHPAGSPEHERVRDYLVERLRALGLEPEVQTATSSIQAAGGIRTATVRNVIGRLPGTASTGAVLITAHYDSRELAPGAGDDGAGIVAILEAMRALRTGGALTNDIIVLFTDAEELGLLGARAFVDEHPWISDVALVLSFEMRGAAGPSIMFETKGENGWVVRALRELDPRPFANSLAAEVYERMPNDTDFTPFKDAGKQGLNFAALGRAAVYHQATDTPENLSEGTLQHHGVRALAALRHFGDADLATVDAPNAVYFTVPFVGLIVYGAGWVVPITGGLAAVLLGVGLVAVRGGARLGRVAAGLGVATLGGALSYGAALGLTRWVGRFHPEAGSLSGSLYHSEGWYVLSLVAAVFVIVTALHTVARRWLSPLEASLGAVVVPFAAAAWASFAVPLAAMNLQWPVAAALLATLVLALFRSRSSGIVGGLACLVLVVPVFVLLVPLSELVWLALTFNALGVVAVLAAVTLHLSLASLDGLRHPNGWWAPLVGLAAAGAALGLGVRTAEARADRPAPSTLIYAYEHGTGAAYWATDPAADPVLDATAIAWAVERAGAPFTSSADLITFGLPWGQAPVATGPVISAEPPEVVILGDTVNTDVRRVTLAARSRIGAERLMFTRDEGGRTRFVSIDGRRIDQPGSVAWIDHWGVPDSMVVLELDMPADEPIGVHILEQHLRPAELLGAGRFERPAALAPDVSTGSDRAIFRYSIAAFADPRHAFVPTASDSVAAGPQPGR
jgi:hypothetical protein